MMLIVKSANVTTLRARLSELLQLVREGETIEIRDRSVTIARLIPVAPNTPSTSRVPPWLERRRRAGVVKVGPMKGVATIRTKMPPGPAKTGAVDALRAERDSGR